MYDIYYAHHQWKYNTPIELYELDLIRRYFPKAKIYNPSTDLDITSLPSFDEAAVMDECLVQVNNCDILVFSSMDGCVGTGVYHEVMEAKKAGKLVFYIWQDELRTDFQIIERKDSVKIDRLYGLVTIADW